MRKGADYAAFPRLMCTRLGRDCTRIAPPCASVRGKYCPDLLQRSTGVVLHCKQQRYLTIAITLSKGAIPIDFVGWVERKSEKK